MAILEPICFLGQRQRFQFLEISITVIPMNLTVTKQKKIRARIKRYERNFKKPPHPGFDDGGGTRFLLGPLYMLLNDVEGALKHYKWFQRKFPDSIDDPLHTFCLALALYRAGKPTDAKRCLKRVYFVNPFLIPAVLRLPHGQPTIKRYTSWSEESYLQYIEAEYLSLWNEEELTWLRRLWESSEFKALVQKDIELITRIEKEPASQRIVLLNKHSTFRDEECALKPQLKIVRTPD